MVCVVADPFEFIDRMKKSKADIKLSDYAKTIKIVHKKRFVWFRIIPSDNLAEMCEFTDKFAIIDCVTYGGETVIMGLRQSSGKITTIFRFSGDCDVSLFLTVLLNVFKESL